MVEPVGGGAYRYAPGSGWAVVVGGAGCDRLAQWVQPTSSSTNGASRTCCSKSKPRHNATYPDSQ
jgi:hypothetical protein